MNLEFPQVLALIGAIGGIIGSVALFGQPLATYAVARLQARQQKPPEVPQGQATDDPLVAAERERRRKAERELKAFRTALRHANDQLAAHGLPLVHPDL